MNRIVECVPNFSEGRDPEKLQRIIRPFYDEKDVRVLDYEQDRDHNRAVVTVIGEPEAVGRAVIAAVGIARDEIDLRHHEGAHPRMGATDVIPFVPIRNVTVEEADALAKHVASEVARLYDIPCFLYEDSASRPEHRNLAAIRKGQFEGMAEKMKDPLWKPDFGPAQPHPSAGVTAVGARMPLVAYNVNLNTADKSIADAIARKIRHIGGGLACVKAMGVALEDRGQTQVSMNLVNYTKSAIYQAVEFVRFEAKRYGVSIVGTELVGLAPMAALLDSAVYYLQLENFSYEQIIEQRLLEDEE